MPDIAELEKVLQITMKRRELLEQALVHSSYCNENPLPDISHNERLEFLGDAVLDVIVAEKLFNDRAVLPEGEMTRRRAAIVRRETLARVAGKIGLGRFLFLGKGEESSGGREKPLNLAGAMEAVIAAVYLDLGMYAARQMVLHLLEGEWNASETRMIDFKSRLQEASQSRFQCVPVYRLVKASGPDHDPQFSVEVRIRNRVAGRAVGRSKKLAETEAARLALEALERDFTVR